MQNKSRLRKVIKAILETFSEYLNNEPVSSVSDIEALKNLSEEHLAYQATPRRNRIRDPRFE